MEQDLRLLILEDVAAEAELAVRALETAGLDCSWRRVASETEFRAGLRELRPDVILSDFSLPGFDGMLALAIVAAEAPETPFIFVSGTIGEERAIDALRHGAGDYVLKTNLVRLRDRTKLLEEACRIAHSVGNYVCAFVMLIDPHTRVASGAAWAGAGRDHQGKLSFRVDDSGRSEPGESISGK